MGDRTAAGEALVTLRTRVDAHFEAATVREPDAFACRSGCAQCCHQRFSVFAVEADRIASALSRLPTAVRQRIRTQADDPAHAGKCPLLVHDRCAVYEERPLICRSHGLAVDDDGAVSHCPLNYTDRAPAPQSVLRLRAVNEPLSIMARLWDGQGLRVEIETLARGSS